jgi:hypothetical protein
MGFAYAKRFPIFFDSFIKVLSEPIGLSQKDVKAGKIDAAFHNDFQMNECLFGHEHPDAELAVKKPESEIVGIIDNASLVKVHQRCNRTRLLLGKVKILKLDEKDWMSQLLKSFLQ